MSWSKSVHVDHPKRSGVDCHYGIGPVRPLLAFALALLVTGCSGAVSPTSNVDRSFLTGEPCAPPCWYGAVPGQIDIEELHEVLEGLDFVDPRSIVEFVVVRRGKEVPVLEWDCSYLDNHWCGRAFFNSDMRLSELVLAIGYDLTVEDAVERLGPPEFTERGSYSSETIGCRMYVFWSARQVVAEHEKEGADTACDRLEAGEPISSALTIVNLVYAEESIFDLDPPAMCCVREPWPESSD